MRIMVDTNVILDILLERQPLVTGSLQVLNRMIERKDKCFLSVSAVTDIYYVLRKATHSEEMAHRQLKKLSTIAHFTDVLVQSAEKAMDSDISDYEDALVDSVASRICCDHILTRNIADFSCSKVPAVTPEEYLDKYCI